MGRDFFFPFIISMLAGAVLAIITVWAFVVHVWWVALLCLVAFFIDMLVCSDMYNRWSG